MPGEWTTRFGSRPPSAAMSEAELRCSFCDRRRDEVEQMIAGQRLQIGQHTRLVAICNECVALCSEIFSEQLQDQDQGPRETPA